MGLPSKRRTKSQKRRRSSHFALGGIALSRCKSCGKPVKPHHVCMACGMYNGSKALAGPTKGERLLKKRERARKAEAADTHEHHDHSHETATATA